MPLSAEDQREIRQLMFVALHYLNLASKAAMATHSSITFGSTTHDFPDAGDVQEPLRSRILISADLASAATRLASVDHVLRGAGDCARRVHEHCRAYFNGRGDDIPYLPAEWFHIMLRDVVGHAEPDEVANDEAAIGKEPTGETPQARTERRRKARAKFIAGTTFGWAYTRLTEIADQLMGFVMDRHGIGDPR